MYALSELQIQNERLKCYLILISFRNSINFAPFMKQDKLPNWVTSLYQGKLKPSDSYSHYILET